MFGVVLWSDEQEQKAVIWCEDHGDLAFYRNTTDADRFQMDAGDWVQFDMTMEHHQRFAHNPRLVVEGVFADLAIALGAAPDQQSDLNSQAVNFDSVPSDQKSAQIIPFLPTRSARQRTMDSTRTHSASG